MSAWTCSLFLLLHTQKFIKMKNLNQNVRRQRSLYLFCKMNCSCKTVYASLDVQQLQMMHNTRNIIITIDCSASPEVSLKFLRNEMHLRDRVLLLSGGSPTSLSPQLNWHSAIKRRKDKIKEKEKERGTYQLHCLHNWIGIRQKRRRIKRKENYKYLEDKCNCGIGSARCDNCKCNADRSCWQLCPH